MGTHEYLSIVQPLVDWLSEHGLALALILIITIAIKRFGIIPIRGIIHRSVRPDRFQNEAEHKEREETLLNMARSVLGVIAWLLAIILIFIELEVNIQPVLAAGGVLGIIIGFGAQNILRDLFAGIYVITESHYQIGDVIDLDGDWGEVEDITLRIVTLRDLDGAVYHIPHGNVNRVKNLSKDYSRINLNIGIAYDSNINRVSEIVDKVGREFAEDEDWRNIVITPPRFWRIDNFGDSSIDIKIVGETSPLHQWAASGEMRKRLKAAFDKEGIEIPFPQRVIHQEDTETRPT